jgi:hypothetical protein
MSTRHLTRVCWPDGHETVERLFDDQATGWACFYCSLSDGVLKPVGRSSTVYIGAHDECLPKPKKAA